MPTLKLSGQQVPQPPLQQGDHASQEEEPHPPARGPKTNTRSLANCTLQGRGGVSKERGGRGGEGRGGKGRGGEGRGGVGKERGRGEGRGGEGEGRGGEERGGEGEGRGGEERKKMKTTHAVRRSEREGITAKERV